tara:strand:+ start:1372 stop:2166 length:795 start_codon:yes stop_codon:yes gene_type:complete
MYNFNYHCPSSLQEAESLYAKSEDPMFLAGGHTLLPTMKQRLNAPTDLIDLAGLTELAGISREGDVLQIGAYTRHADVAASELVQAAIPALAKLARGIGDTQVRNRGTIGGSVANNDPAADYPAALLGLGATVVTTKRAVPADEFFVDMFETVLEEGEIITAVTFPVKGDAEYIKFANPASRYATVGVFINRHNDGVRVAITGAASSVFRCSEYEAALSSSFTESALEGITLRTDNFNEDLHASVDYRANLCAVIAKRVIVSMA